MIENNSADTTNLYGNSSLVSTIVLLPYEVDIMPIKDREKRLKAWREYHQKNRIKRNSDRLAGYYTKRKEESDYVPISQRIKQEKHSYYKKYPDRRKAETRTYRNKLRADCCLNCGETEHLYFHHIDYDNDIGFTLCAKCHSHWHMVFKEFKGDAPLPSGVGV